MITKIRGFKDILPGETELWQHIENTASDLFEDFGFRQIRVPLMERTELFARSIGEETDIVEKEMYTFADRSGELLTLRPEATASIVRAYIEHRLYNTEPVQKLYTIGPMFRRERPQKGRYRQFYQIDAEVFGVDSPLVDAQVIFMLSTLFSRLKVTDIRAHINSLGCLRCRPAFKQSLLNMLESKADLLCPDCKRRSSANPLRVLDCKAEGCRQAMTDAPSIVDHLCTDCRSHFQTVQKSLQDLGVEYIIDKRLVRGLDYYTRTTFEIQTTLLGAQNAVAGGGRYDGLVKALGGPDQPAIGFAVGFDRLVEVVPLQGADFVRNPHVFIAALGPEAQAMAARWICDLAADGIRAEMDFSDRSLKSQMKRADKSGAGYVLIVGEQEIAQNAAVLRNMTTHGQEPVSLSQLPENLKSMIIVRYKEKRSPTIG